MAMRGILTSKRGFSAQLNIGVIKFKMGIGCFEPLNGPAPTCHASLAEIFLAQNLDILICTSHRCQRYLADPRINQTGGPRVLPGK